MKKWVYFFQVPIDGVFEWNNMEFVKVSDMHGRCNLARWHFMQHARVMVDDSGAGLMGLLLRSIHHG